MWSVAVYQVFWLWDLPGGTCQGQPPPVLCPGPAGMSYKVICRGLLLALVLEVSRRGQAMNHGQLLLIPGLGPVNERYRAC